MPQLFDVSFHILKREYARAQHLNRHSRKANRRSISSLRLLCSSICFPASPSASRTCLSPSDWAAAAAVSAVSRLPIGQLKRQYQRLRWQAASSPRSHAHVQLQRQDGLMQASEEEVAASRSMLKRKLEKKPTIFRTTEIDLSFSGSLQCFCILFCMRSALATAWQPGAPPPLANPDSNRLSDLLPKVIT